MKLEEQTTDIYKVVVVKENIHIGITNKKCR